MEEQIIFSLERNGVTVYRLIAQNNGSFLEQQADADGFVRCQAVFDRFQLVSLATSILEWEKNHPVTGTQP